MRQLNGLINETSPSLQGSKRFLEDQLDASDSPMLSEVQFAACLDTLGAGSSISMHVSKKPKDDSPSAKFFEVGGSLLI